jgi:hypothetical protein
LMFPHVKDCLVEGVWNTKYSEQRVALRWQSEMRGADDATMETSPTRGTGDAAA